MEAACVRCPPAAVLSATPPPGLAACLLHLLVQAPHCCEALLGLWHTRPHSMVDSPAMHSAVPQHNTSENVCEGHMQHSAAVHGSSRKYGSSTGYAADSTVLF